MGGIEGSLGVNSDKLTIAAILTELVGLLTVLYIIFDPSDSFFVMLLRQANRWVSLRTQGRPNTQMDSYGDREG